MRIVASLLFCSLAVPALASFDLMLLGDNTTAGSQRVQRYDPVNRVALGSFGQGYFNQNIQDIVTDSRTGRAYVLETGGIVKIFNYNTGDFIDAFTTQSFYTAMNYDSVNDRLLMGGGFGSSSPNSFVYAPNGAPIIQLATSIGMYSAPVRREDSNWYAGWDLNAGGSSFNYIRRYDSTTGAGLAGTVNGPTFASGAVRSSAFLRDGKLAYLRLGTTNLELYGIQASSAGYIGSAFLMTNLGASTNDNVDMVRGHNETLFILNGASVITYHTGLNSAMGTQNLSFASAANIRGMAIVLAPEPSTMLLLGIGLAGLARHKKKS